MFSSSSSSSLLGPGPVRAYLLGPGPVRAYLVLQFRDGTMELGEF